MLTQAEEREWQERDERGAAIVNAEYASGLLTDTEIVAYLMRHGNSRVPCSRYGTDTETCAYFVARAAGPWLEVCEGDAASALESLMSAAVNDSDELADAGDEPSVCGGTGNHDGQPIDACDECSPWDYDAGMPAA